MASPLRILKTNLVFLCTRILFCKGFVSKNIFLAQSQSIINKCSCLSLFICLFCPKYQIYVCKRDIFLLFICLFLQHAFASYASSSYQTFYRNNCIACRQKVSHQCVKACDTSKHWGHCKRSRTGCMQRAFHQYV